MTNHLSGIHPKSSLVKWLICCS